MKTRAEESQNTNRNTQNKQMAGTACLAAEAVSAKSCGLPVEVRGDVRSYPWPFRQPGLDFGCERIGTHPRMAEGPGVAERSGASPGIPQAVVGKQLTNTQTKHVGWPQVATSRSPLRTALLYKSRYVISQFKCIAFELNSRRHPSATPPTRFAATVLSGQCPMHAVSVWISLYPFPPRSMESSNNNRKPVKVFRSRGVSASVFANQSKKGEPFYKVCLQRTYWDGENYKSSDTFGRVEAPVAVLLMLQAWQFVLQTAAAAKKDASKED